MIQGGTKNLVLHWVSQILNIVLQGVREAQHLIYLQEDCITGYDPIPVRSRFSQQNLATLLVLSLQTGSSIYNTDSISLEFLSQYQVGSIFVIPCSWFHFPGSMYLAQCSWFHVPGLIFLVTCSWFHVPDFMSLVPCFQFHVPSSFRLKSYYIFPTSGQWLHVPSSQFLLFAYVPGSFFCCKSRFIMALVPGSQNINIETGSRFPGQKHQNWFPVSRT